MAGKGGRGTRRTRLEEDDKVLPWENDVKKLMIEDMQ
jgi:hypothetical protein